jgi:hypothetical protein
VAGEADDLEDFHATRSERACPPASTTPGFDRMAASYNFSA